MGRASRRKNRPLPAIRPEWSWSLATILLVVGAGFSALAGWIFWKEWYANNRYVETTAVVVDRRVHTSPPTSSDNQNTYRPEVLIRYSVGNSRFHSWAYAELTVEDSGLTGEALAQAKIKAFAIGESYPCWYDPDHPEHVVLMRGYTWPWYLLWGSVGLGLVGAGLWGMYRKARKTPDGERGA